MSQSIDMVINSVVVIVRVYKLIWSSLTIAFYAPIQLLVLIYLYIIILSEYLFNFGYFMIDLDKIRIGQV